MTIPTGDGDPTGTFPPASLSDEHAVLRREVTSRADRVLREADEGRWPVEELAALMDYLHLEVLRQVVDEEWLLFRTARHTADDMARLRADHLELRLTIEELPPATLAGPDGTIRRLGRRARDQGIALIVEPDRLLDSTTAEAAIHAATAAPMAFPPCQGKPAFALD